MSRELLLIAVAASGLGFSSGAFPQAYPSRPIRVIVPASPGGAADILSRTIAQKLADAWGQQVIVDNRAGDSVRHQPTIGIDTGADYRRGCHGIAQDSAPNLALFRNLRDGGRSLVAAGQLSRGSTTAAGPSDFSHQYRPVPIIRCERARLRMGGRV